MEIDVTRRGKEQRQTRRIFGLMLGGFLLVVLGVFGCVYGPSYIAFWNYAPQEDDIVFQSLPRARLVNAIEGATGSPFSHCGMVAREDGQWTVYEAYRKVERTPLKEFIFRGRQRGFAVYRLSSPHQHLIPAIIARLQPYMGRPYDDRYRLDDDHIYCSELIYKAFRDATQGQQLGELVRLGDLNWRPFENTIKHYEGGPVPLDREMITPQQMAWAKQLELVFAHKIAVPEPPATR